MSLVVGRANAVLNRSDWLLAAAQKPLQRWALKSVGYPLPVQLDRTMPTAPRFTPLGSVLSGQAVRVVTAAGTLAPLIAGHLSACGASVAAPGSTSSVEGLVIDASALSLANAAALWDACKTALPSVKRGGRVAIVCDQVRALRAGGADSDIAMGSGAGMQPDLHVEAMHAAVAFGLTGFVKSAAKEVGGNGVTLNLLAVDVGAASAAKAAAIAPLLSAPLSFLLSADSAFISSQVLSPWLPTGAADGPYNRGAQKVAVVTGGARGIGAAVVRRLAAEGAHVVVVDVPQAGDAVQAVATAVSGTPFVGDVTDPAFPAKLVSMLNATFGGVDVVVHNAGIIRDRTLVKMTDAQLNSVLAVNLRAITTLNTALGVHNAASDVSSCIRSDGRVVMMSSINGIAGAFGQTNYAFTKASLISYARQLSVLPSVAQRKIAVSAVAPGFIETDMTAAIPALGRELGRRSNCLYQGGLPHDIAAAVAFLTSSGALGMSGQTLRVCGGHMTGR